MRVVACNIALVFKDIFFYHFLAPSIL